MGKIDDNDNEKDTYDSNVRSSCAKDDNVLEEEALSPTIRAFCHFVTSAKFRQELDMFFDGYCEGFEDADIDSEQRLEWTSVFEKYVALIEKLLDDFCGIHQIEPQEVFSMVQHACHSGVLDDELLPSILSVTEYTYFIEQIGLMAHHDHYVKRARVLGDQALEETKLDYVDNLSGLWRIATKDGPIELTNTKSGLDRYLSALGIPNSLRGLFRGTLFSNKGLCIIHVKDSITIIADTVTGRHKQDFILDGNRRDVANVSGKKTPWVAHGDSRTGRVIVRNECPSGLPRGSKIVNTWEMTGRHLKCTSEIERPNGVVMHEFFYMRQGENSHKKRSTRRAAGHK